MKQLYTKLDRLIDATTMYRVMLYTLGALVLWSFVLSLTYVIPFSWYDLGSSLLVIVCASLFTHTILSWLTKAPANRESSIITALILFLILTPELDTQTLTLNAAVASFAIASKYALAYRLRHVCNPVAIALVAAGAIGYIGVEWWVSSRYMFPVVIVTSLLVILKTNRWHLLLTYIGTSTLLALFLFREFATIPEVLSIHFLSWPTIFFAAFMLTEPLSLPARRSTQYGYALIVAVLATIPFTFGPLHGTPELALVVANLFTFVVDRPARYKLTFLRKNLVGPQTYEYIFSTPHPINHQAGQYLEWTLPHPNPDSRGIRRYFTIVSPPQNKNEVSFAVRHVTNQSSWKQALADVTPGAIMYATVRAGDFVLPKKHTQLVFIAGGIGITPFMSMIRSKTEKEATKSAHLFFCNNTYEERSFVDELEAARDAGITTTYVTTANSDREAAHKNEALGFITADMLEQHVPNWQSATFFISGPPGMVAAYETLLLKNSVPKRQIITDYFPGLA